MIRSIRLYGLIMAINLGIGFAWSSPLNALVAGWMIHYMWLDYRVDKMLKEEAHEDIRS